MELTPVAAPRAVDRATAARPAAPRPPANAPAIARRGATSPRVLGPVRRPEPPRALHGCPRPAPRQNKQLRPTAQPSPPLAEAEDTARLAVPDASAGLGHVQDLSWTCPGRLEQFPAALTTPPSTNGPRIFRRNGPHGARVRWQPPSQPPPTAVSNELSRTPGAGRASPRGPGLQRTLCSSVYCVASQMLTPGDEALSGEGARDLIHSDGDDPRDPPHVMTRRSPSRMVPSTPMYHPLTQWRDSDILLR
eukprot:scaffold3551_cov118-Isochrysis_galbana.AAC.8